MRRCQLGYLSLINAEIIVATEKKTKNEYNEMLRWKSWKSFHKRNKWILQLTLKVVLKNWLQPSKLRLIFTNVRKGNRQSKMHREFQLTTLFSSYSKQERSSRLKSGGAQGGTIFSSNFLLHFWAIWKNDPFSETQKVPGLKPRLPRRVLRPWNRV